MSSRQKRFEEDVKLTMEMSISRNWPFEGFEVTESSFSFSTAMRKYVIYKSEDYPENSYISRSDKPDDLEICNQPMMVLVQKIKDDILPECGISSDTSTSVDYQNAKMPAERSISMESATSVYSDCRSGDSDEDMIDYYVTDDEENGEDHSMNQNLLSDMETVRLLYSEKAISYRLLSSIDEIDIELAIPLSFLEPDITAAWKINREEPLIIRLNLSVSRYLDMPDPPKVEVFQPSNKEKFGLGSQMKKIIQQFLSDNWRQLSNEKISQEMTGATKSFSIPSDLFTAASSETSGAKSKKSDKQDAYYVDDSKLSQIMEMGFSSEIARNALIITRGDVQEATNLLLCHPESCTDLEVGKPAEERATKTNPSRQFSHPPPTKRMKKNRFYSKQRSMIASATAPNLQLPEIEDLNLIPTSTLDGRNAKRVPSLQNGFLVQMFRYARQRIPTLNEYCVVCDEPHVFQNGAMLKPSVCSRELCVFAFQTLGVMSDAAEDIATGAEVVDLLIAMTRAACQSSRKNVIFDPYPTVVDPTNPRELSLHPKDKNYSKVEKVMLAMLPMSDMTRLSSSDLKKSMDEQDILLYPLLQWIITSNRSHIVKLPVEKQLKFMHTPHQFLLLSSPPAKEAAFRAAKETYGSTFAFHGSGIENWHSIIRLGLVVASGTKYQLKPDLPCVPTGHWYLRFPISSFAGEMEVLP
ncbi:hypothetical protein ScPMuIL_018659 [Solemya velum]